MDDNQVEVLEVSASNEIKKLDHIIKSMLGSMDGGEISTSAYDTAWVALIKDIDGNDAPQFPSCLQWIADNQLPDGSWGDDKIFLAHDRLINTLACIAALKSWNVHLDKCEKGISFVKGNLSKLENENEEHTTCGFEVAFPSLLEIARSLDIEIPDHSHVLQNIYAMRNFKLKRIPKEKLHSVPTTLLFSLEGMPELDWEKLMKLQFQNGSFLFSLSSTAYAFMQTQDENCLKYLTQVVRRFNGGVPSSYPMDLFERLWAVDRLQRLRISRYFRSEIKECMDYIYRYWNEKGIFSGRNTRIPDIDDTSMGFRLLRLHGYDVSADVLQYFEEGGEFFCFLGETSQAITPTFNLYRASQVQFPEEKILEKAKQFSARFLREKQAANKLLDKWIMAKDLPGEVGYALDIPWFASLPRIEARFYIKQYGGEDDVWIGKTLYRMPNISNNFYLQLAKIDYNNCQAIHQSEWISMQRWYTKCKLENFGTSKRALLLAYFLASASIYEPERKRERFAWAKAAVLVETIASYFSNQQDSRETRKIFVDEFRNCINPQEGLASNETEQGFTGTILRQHIYHSFDPQPAQGRDISHQLLHAWEKWLMKWQAQGDRHQGEAELIVQTINLSAGNCLSEDLLSHQEYKRLMDLTNTICHKLVQYQNQKVHDASDSDVDIDHMQIDFAMQELVQVVLQSSSNGIDFEVKQTFLTVTKSFYYSAYCDSKTINFHIDKVLFERVE
ncbi:Ent-copalyl diphosphate synthase [Citrus sinensis]|uniref:(-)-kolavenyl diphosphate synthase TPS28, chloroplastic-like isoform X1 n=1 Tax=Citrus sinensis TaxID=2711 RepID=UPI002191DF2A|nr:(-)-kolavenyl diphosphate synthase TPS28, chloroplastic-like isoform X1 [Citrus sinensis]XP_052294201.1 (-)-kolavenyl diphosphate synthase TPS28, chloroplastic-like isoform X2 [Citrus sinensis]XP_052294202.1 (-)-kolavenyl diphosphate synthase TPS28, chloroplastic-like isoform X3 [Citrus sinensis]XP_052294203.1 (-)-kolavenyl diphosphate synthase TPS28, chloroplastic-like isoform X3 [Citrus sinensis]XP_052294204.1 (-)-kolavenyl diphosphate synthase TPS28, chloroplastic-like isoform X3 [Citrus 